MDLRVLTRLVGSPGISNGLKRFQDTLFFVFTVLVFYSSLCGTHIWLFVLVAGKVCFGQDLYRQDKSLATCFIFLGNVSLVNVSFMTLGLEFDCHLASFVFHLSAYLFGLLLVPLTHFSACSHGLGPRIGGACF